MCEGPFITGADDSFPPQCKSPVDVLPAVVIVWVVVLVVILVLRALTKPTTTSD